MGHFKKLSKILFWACLIITLSDLIIRGEQSFQNPQETDKNVKIGLLLPDNQSVSARHGAEMAIRKANKEGGLNGLPVQIVVRSMEGPWGTGSKEAVNLVFEDKVWAILGSHDGRNAHLVEQVIAKTHVVFLSAWASDPTLSQAFVPWFFSCVPNDLRQDDALVNEIYNNRKFTRIAVVSDSGYDSKLASESFVKKVKLSGKNEPDVIYYDNSSLNCDSLTYQINKAEVNCIVLFGQPSVSFRIIKQLRERKMKQTVFGSLSLLGEDKLSDNEFNNYENVILISSGNWSGSKSLTFQQEFQRTYGKKPDAVAMFAYDGMDLIIEAIRIAGTDREKIQESLLTMHYEGVTGPIKFDERGNRAGTPGLMQIKNGIPVDIEK